MLGHRSRKLGWTRERASMSEQVHHLRWWNHRSATVVFFLGRSGTHMCFAAWQGANNSQVLRDSAASVWVRGTLVVYWIVVRHLPRGSVCLASVCALHINVKHPRQCLLGHCSEPTGEKHMRIALALFCDEARAVNLVKL